jgi:hypothetical protein
MAGEILGVGTQTLSSPVLPGGITNGSITTSTGRPYSLSTMDVSAGLTYDAINRKLQIESTLDSVFVDLGADVVFTGKKIAIPDAIIMRVKSEKGARTQVMPLENPLVGPGRGGTAEPQQGYERVRTLEYQKIYYNEYSYGVTGETFGVNYNDLNVFDYYSGEQPALSKWFAEDEDKQIHEALLETYSWVLEKTGTALTQNYNNNMFIANTEFGNQPTYSNTPATYRTNMNTAFAAADTGTNGVNANIDLDYLIALSYYAENEKRIKPINIGGQSSYVVLLPAPQYNKLLQTNSGQLGAVWQNVTALSDEEQKFPGIVGRVMNLVIIKDPRYPTLECTASYGNNTHSVVYAEPGNYDLRNKTVYDASSNAAWDVGFLLGAGAVIDWTVTPVHFGMEQTEFGKKYAKAAFCERGIQLGNTFDTDTASNLNKKNFGSIALFFTASTIVQTA